MMTALALPDMFNYGELANLKSFKWAMSRPHRLRYWSRLCERSRTRSPQSHFQNLPFLNFWLCSIRLIMVKPDITLGESSPPVVAATSLDFFLPPGAFIFSFEALIDYFFDPFAQRQLDVGKTV